MATSIDADVPPPLHVLPKAKEKKYDRQLRLWGASGQVALEKTHILLINNGPGVTGVEALKNLVLPGVGHFTILDPAMVSEADLGVNFFLEDTSLGKFRAEETVRLLLELNPEVQGYALTTPLEMCLDQLVDGNLPAPEGDLVPPYSMVLVAAPIDATIMDMLRTQMHTYRMPLFYFHSVGFLSTFSMLVPDAFPIIDTHPDSSTTTDLRLLTPWPELSQFTVEMTKGLEEGTMKAADKAHIPWVCILLHYLEQWKQKHDGKAPDNYNDKGEFRSLVRAGDPSEENFDEACAAVLKSLNPPTAPSAVREIFAAPEAIEAEGGSPSFWVIVRAVSQFYNTRGQLPLPGAVPDMKAQSADFIRLQNIYKAKARADCAEVLDNVRTIEKDTKRIFMRKVDEGEVANFCKGAAHIHLVRGRAFQVAQEHCTIVFGERAKAMANELSMPDSLISLYIAFLAYDTFIASHSAEEDLIGGQGLQIPGTDQREREFRADVETMTNMAYKIVDNLVKEAGISLEDAEYSDVKKRTAKYCLEIVRAGGGELHNVASVTGGLIAQEVIKVITQQYVPVDNTCVFDGVTSRTQVLRVSDARADWL
ncbi:hypothetical protein LTR53_007464 [Teratosphaeriaceae sp. CCFEE 6253]|nr:hypothetical protein LTR53_007464 [Teratosphaeriaceae sp. CCFEE 6253]